jgi:MoaA/NifB/PqqE/SkfB family radical SAM enzyme
MVTRRNMRYVTSREWMDAMWNSGARFCFLIDYIPSGRDAAADMVLTDNDMSFKEREVARRNAEARPFVVNFPPDEYRGTGCLSGGNGFVHINADGFVEPCPFCHYASENVKEKPLKAILGSPFLASIRETFGSKHDHSGTCMLFKNAVLVEKIAAATGAKRTDVV